MIASAYYQEQTLNLPVFFLSLYVYLVCVCVFILADPKWKADVSPTSLPKLPLDSCPAGPTLWMVTAGKTSNS